MRDKIEQWLADIANLDNQAEAFNTKIEDRIDLDLTGMIEQCFNDLQGWVSVDDKLPKDWECVMIFTRHEEYGLAEFRYDHWEVLSDEHVLSNMITHWKPLLEPPK
jgi:hypothetical protein